MAGASGPEGDNGPFDYKPNLPMAYVMAILWILAMGYMLFQYIKHKAWFFWVMVIGVFMEFVGFIARIPAIRTRGDEGFPVAYIVSWICTLLAPSFLAAACYMAFGRLIFYVTPPARRNFRSLWVPARFITPIFVILDILSFLIMAAGGARVGAAVGELNDKNGDHKKAQDDMKSGYNIAKTGVIVQLVCFGFFTFVGARILFVANNWRSQWPDAGAWKKLAWAINAACALILFRSVFRLIEFLGGDASDFIMKHEVFIYVFDAFPMLFVAIIFFVIPPANYLPRLFMSPRYRKHLRKQESLGTTAGGISTPMGEPTGVPMASYGHQSQAHDSEYALAYGQPNQHHGR